jgi:hypothetical protein
LYGTKDTRVIDGCLDTIHAGILDHVLTGTLFTPCTYCALIPVVALGMNRAQGDGVKLRQRLERQIDDMAKEIGRLRAMTAHCDYDRTHTKVRHPNQTNAEIIPINIGYQQVQFTRGARTVHSYLLRRCGLNRHKVVHLKINPQRDAADAKVAEFHTHRIITICFVWGVCD